MPVPFRFDIVLRVREAERDHCQVRLVHEQTGQTALAAERQRVTREREHILQEITQLQFRDQWSAQDALALHQQADLLEVQLLRIQDDLQRAAANVARCLKELTEANTAVLGLEKLAGRHQAEQLRLEQRTAERDREDTWRAA